VPFGCYVTIYEVEVDSNRGESFAVGKIVGISSQENSKSIDSDRKQTENIFEKISQKYQRKAVEDVEGKLYSSLLRNSLQSRIIKTAFYVFMTHLLMFLLSGRMMDNASKRKM
jgi:hypothetical protein